MPSAAIKLLRATDFVTSDIRPTSIRLSNDLLRFVDERAAEQGCSRSFFISDVLKRYQEWRKTQDAVELSKGKKK